MPIFRRDGLDVLFVHVPKTGGTSVERMFDAAGFQTLYRDTKTGPGTANRLRTVSPQHLHAHLLQQLFHVDMFDLVFMITREPVARFKSEYGMRNSKDLRADADAVDVWAERALSRYQRDPTALDNHLRPQVDFYLPGSVVYRLEDGLEEIMGDVNDRVGGGLPTTTLRALDRKSSSGVATSDIKVSDHLRQRLQVLYHEDFQRFRYPSDG